MNKLDYKKITFAVSFLLLLMFKPLWVGQGLLICVALSSILLGVGFILLFTFEGIHYNVYDSPLDLSIKGWKALGRWFLK